MLENTTLGDSEKSLDNYGTSRIENSPFHKLLQRLEEQTKSNDKALALLLEKLEN